MGPGPVRAAWGGQPDGVAGGGPEVREGLGSGCLNSRIVIIIFETENLFFPARGGYSAIHYGIRRWGERGLRFPPSPLRPSPCRGCCVGLKSGCGPFWAAGWVRPALAGFQFVPARRRAAPAAGAGALARRCKLDYTRFSPRPHPAGARPPPPCAPGTGFRRRSRPC